MLSQIKLPSQASKTQSATKMLTDCHNRIRHFSGVAVKLAHAQGVAEAEIVQAAEGLLRYFTIALPLHEADENISIHPRLRKAVPVGELAGPAADAMVDQHLAIDELVERLIPLWTILRAEPAKEPELASEMCAISSRLQEIFTAHLQMEEETIFPAMDKYLSEAELATIVSEMQERRKAG
jgi:hemerythrin-like domain-containing protein